MASPPLTLVGKTALVTGASRGIGRAIAIELARRGAQVVVNYRAAEAAALDVVQHIKDQSGEATAIQADVSDEQAVHRLVAMTQEIYQHVDILVNNAGITRDQFVMKMSGDDWDTVLKTNLYGAFYCCKAVIRSMMRQQCGGRIINVASIVADIGRAKQANYVASKAGLVGFTKSLAREVASWNITVNGVAPGFIVTDMTSNTSDDELRRVVDSLIPLRRTGQPEDIAAAVAFLASNDASYITGQIICVDGGFTM